MRSVLDLDRALCADPALAALPGRFLFAVDDGSGLLDARDADVVLRGGRLVLAGVATSAAGDVASALDAARVFLAIRDDEWRIRDVDGGVEAIAARLGASVLGPVDLAPRRTLQPGVADGAVVALPPLARLDREALLALAALGLEVRVAQGRMLVLPSVPAARVDEVVGVLDDLGLVLELGSGWVGLSACAGLGRCARARMDVRAEAARRAAERGAGAPIEHWSACERRCGEPADVVRSVVAPVEVLA